MATRVAAALVALLLAACSGGDAPTGPGTTPPPAPIDTAFAVPALLREFRGIWIATVANLDWPSRPTLTAEQQRAELVGLLDRAVEAGANAVVFQVRVNGERLYRAADEPWATALSGRTDVDPGYVRCNWRSTRRAPVGSRCMRGSTPSAPGTRATRRGWPRHTLPAAAPTCAAFRATA